MIFICKWGPAGLTGWADVLVASVSPSANRGLEGWGLAEIATERGVDPIDVFCDLLPEEQFDVDVLLFKLDAGDVDAFVRDEQISVCTDGLFGDNPHPRAYGTFPRVLGELARERDFMSLPEAVRKMIPLPARQFGVSERALVRSGMCAGLVVFDPDTVTDGATYEHPRREPTSIPYVLVGGSSSFVMAT